MGKGKGTAADGGGICSITAVDFSELPEGCIAHILSFTSPKDVCRSASVSSTFRSAADAVWERFLPPEYGAEIWDAVSQIFSPSASKKELYFYLCQFPVFIHGGAKAMFGQPSLSVRYEAIKFVYNSRLKEGASVREHVLNMMIHFYVAEVNGAFIDEKSQVSFIIESLPKSFLRFRTNMVMNKIEYNLASLLNELHTYQSLHGSKEQEKETNVVTSKFRRGSYSGNKSESTSFKKNKRIEKRKRKWKGIALATDKSKAKATDKGKCFHCGIDGHWKWNCPKYLAEKKAEKEAQGFQTVAIFMETGDLDKSVAVVNKTSDVVEDSPNKIITAGISNRISSEMLRDIFTAFGPLKACHFEINNNLNEPCAFLEEELMRANI